jgi:glucose/arabinose dehydrogenase
VRNRPWIIAGIVAVLVVAAGAVAALALTGAPTSSQTAMPTSSASAGPTTTPIPTPSSTPSASPIPQPTPTPTPTRPALEKLVLTERSLGTLAIFTDPNTYDPATTIVKSIPCKTNYSEIAWAPALSSSTGDGRNPYETEITGGSVYSIAISDPAIRTDRGARPGMTWSEIAALYPEATDSSDGTDGTVHRVFTSVGMMLFYSPNPQIVSEIVVTQGGNIAGFKHVKTESYYANCQAS